MMKNSQQKPTLFFISQITVITSQLSILMADVTSVSNYSQTYIVHAAPNGPRQDQNRSDFGLTTSLSDSKYSKYDDSPLYDKNTISVNSLVSANSNVDQTLSTLFISGKTKAATNSSNGGAGSYLVSSNSCQFTLSEQSYYSTFASTYSNIGPGKTPAAWVHLERLTYGSNGLQRQTIFWFKSGYAEPYVRNVPSTTSSGGANGLLPAGDYEYSSYSVCGGVGGSTQPGLMFGDTSHTLYVAESKPETPPDVRTGIATNVGLYSATLNGTVWPNGNPITAQFYWVDGTGSIFSHRVNVPLSGFQDPQNVSVTINFGGFRQTSIIRYVLYIEHEGNSYSGGTLQFDPPNANPPQLKKFGDRLALTKSTYPGMLYQFQKTSSLVSGDWQNVGDAFSGNGAEHTEFLDLRLPSEFYRVLIQEAPSSP